MNDNVEHLFLIYWLSVYLLWRNVYPEVLTIFISVIYLFITEL